MYDISVLNCQKFSGIISVVYKLRAHAGQIGDSVKYQLK